MTPFLPPVVPFGSHQWPTLVTPGTGPASIADLSDMITESRTDLRERMTRELKDLNDGKRA